MGLNAEGDSCFLTCSLGENRGGSGAGKGLKEGLGDIGNLVMVGVTGKGWQGKAGAEDSPIPQCQYRLCFSDYLATSFPFSCFSEASRYLEVRLPHFKDQGRN